jgi:hypothetical protein
MSAFLFALLPSFPISSRLCLSSSSPLSLYLSLSLSLLLAFEVSMQQVSSRSDQ